MADVNVVSITGNLTKDSTTHTYQSAEGTRLVIRFSVAVGRRGRDAGADFINCTFFARADSQLVNWLRKGVEVACTGRLHSGKYQNQNGETVFTTDVVVDTLKPNFDSFRRLYGGQPDGQRPAPAVPPQQQAPQYAPAGYQQAAPQQTAPQQQAPQYAPAGYQQAAPQQAVPQQQRMMEDTFETIDEDVPF